MKKLLFATCVLVGALSVIGCTSVDKAVGNTTPPTGKGDLWYAKTKKFMIFQFGNQVFYCPPVTTQGSPAKCIQAKLHEKGETTAAPDFGGGFGAPAAPGFGAPAAPGYGAPAAPGYGAPATPGYGVPATPGYGAPATPGYGTPAPAPAPTPSPNPPPPGY